MAVTAAQTKPKKTVSTKKPLSHPPFAEMIAEAIVNLKERTGSSQIAISKFIEENHKDLPSTFKKLLLHNLKKLVAAGKLVKVKNSFKIAPAVKASVTADVKKPKTVAKTKSAPSAPKTKSAAAVKSKAVVKPKAKATKPKVKSVKSPAKKKAPVKSVKKAPVKSVKKPKSVKSPVKKAAVAKKAKK